MVSKVFVMTVLIEIAVMREGAKLIQALLRRNANAGGEIGSATQAALSVVDVMNCFNDLNLDQPRAHPLSSHAGIAAAVIHTHGAGSSRGWRRPKTAQ